MDCIHVKASDDGAFRVKALYIGNPDGIKDVLGLCKARVEGAEWWQLVVTGGDRTEEPGGVPPLRRWGNPGGATGRA